VEIPFEHRASVAEVEQMKEREVLDLHAVELMVVPRVEAVSEEAEPSRKRVVLENAGRIQHPALAGHWMMVEEEEALTDH
jgi:hypothetical protein